MYSRSLFLGQSIKFLELLNHCFSTDFIYTVPLLNNFHSLFFQMTFTEYPYNNLRNKFGAYLTDKGFDLLNR